MSNVRRFLANLVVVLLLASPLCPVHGQTTAFTYQGKLAESGNPAAGNFQMQFKLFDLLGGGMQIGPTLTDVPVTATAGVFTVMLDFGSNPFPGANRWLEIAVRHNAGESYSVLSPREMIASSPYSVRTLSAAIADTALDSQKLGGVAASQFVQTNDSRLSDARVPAAGSGSYIQNGSLLQPASFNIGGNGYVGGNIGVGTTNPISRVTVHSQGFSGFGFTHTDGTRTVGSYVSSNGGWFGTQSNDPLHFFTNNSTQQVTLAQNGNLGIGTTSPPHRLSIAGGPAWTSFSWGGAIALENASAIGWHANAAGNRFGIGQSTGGLSFFRTASNPGTTGSPPVYDLTINDSGDVGVGTATPGARLTIGGPGTNGFALGVNGHAGQNLNSGGFVKAMVRVNPFNQPAQYIIGCYNGISGAQPPNCGFSVTRTGTGGYFVDFDSPISDRFLSLTVRFSGFAGGAYPLDPMNPNRVAVGIWDSIFSKNVDDAFYLLVF